MKPEDQARIASFLREYACLCHTHNMRIVGMLVDMKYDTVEDKNVQTHIAALRKLAYGEKQAAVERNAS